MSAAIVQKNSGVPIYFECGDIYNAASKSSENEHGSVSTRMNGNNNSANSVNGVPMMQDMNSALEGNDMNGMNQYDSKDKLDRHHNPASSHALKDNEHYNFHNALTRTISQPQPQPPRDANVTTLVTTLIENLGSMNLHRKLERTQSEPLPQQVNTSRYKTELCRPFEEAGECKYGEKCQFAHGYHELRNLQRHPKYKTEYCRTFHSVGFCPYGPRCHFVHNADEVRDLVQFKQMLQEQAAKMTNHSTNNFNNCISAYPVSSLKQSAASAIGVSGVGGNGLINSAVINQTLPLSPPLSMSTGSDRESPTGSLSLSPTTSMTNFPFGEQISPQNSTVFPTAFSYANNTPPESPNAPISPVNTPPPNFVQQQQQQQQHQTQLTNHHHKHLNHNHNQTQQMYIKPLTIQGKPVLQKSSSSPIAVIRNVSKTPTKVNSTSSLNGDDARLPVFNRLSSAFDSYPNIVL